MDPSEAGIARCIRLAREGQRESLDELLQTHRNYLRVLADSCLHREMRGKADASDVVQETLPKVHQNFRHFRGTTELEWMAWLRKILVNHMTDFQKGFRRERRNVHREQPLESLMERSSAMLRSLGPSPSQEAQRREAAALVADAIAELDPEDRDVVILRNLHELDWKTVGERTGRSPDAARMLWARAMQRLGGLLEGRVS